MNPLPGLKARVSGLSHSRYAKMASASLRAAIHPRAWKPGDFWQIVKKTPSRYRSTDILW